MRRLFFFLLLLFTIPLMAFSLTKKQGLASIHILDRNGFSETISNPERLKQYENVNFLSTMPYEKVLRVYHRDAQSNVFAYVTSYYENGQIKQYLEICNGRAWGNYWEWHSNGVPKLQAYVVGGEADIDPASESTWLFDGTSLAWDDQERLLAEIPYANGELEGIARYFHCNGTIWKRIPYCHNQIEGISTIYKDNGDILQTTEYQNGKKQGKTLRYWSPGKLSASENYDEGRLVSGEYYTPEGDLFSTIADGCGMRPVFAKDHVCEMHEYRGGIQEGIVQIFNPYGKLLRSYHIKDELNHGADIEYYEDTPHDQPKISLTWVEGEIKGEIKTWYRNGTLESQKELQNNKKHGLFSAWYQTGELMMLEEYDKDALIKGEYFRKGEQKPVSAIQNGEGVATLFDSEGHFVNRATYRRGKPE